MKRVCRFAGTIAVFGLLTSTGCTATREPRPQQAPASTQPIASRPPEPTATRKILLRGAMLPRAQAQPVMIRLFEERDTVGPNTGKVTHELILEISGILAAGKTEPDGSLRAILAFQRVRLIMKASDQPSTTLAYDSASDQLKKGNPLADTMAIIADSKLHLRVSRDGRLLELDGLDGKWRTAGMVMAPPGLLTAQWLFRDASMAELVAEALFPPMPSEPVGLGDAWETDVPANIPLVAQLVSHRRNTLAEDKSDAASPSAVVIKGTGTILPGSSQAGSPPPAIQPIIQAGAEEFAQLIDPAVGTLVQSSQRTLEAKLVLAPPQGSNRSEMSLKQTRTLQGIRGAVPPASGQ